MTRTFLLLCAMATAQLCAHGQNIYGTTDISIDPTTNTGVADCETDTDAAADDGYYGVAVTCTVTDSKGNTVASGNDHDASDAQGYAAVTLAFKVTPGITYTAVAEHSATLIVPYDDDDPLDGPHGPSAYFDEYHFDHYIEFPDIPTSDRYDGFGPGPNSTDAFRLIERNQCSQLDI